jgi:hypothetical protein
MNNKFRNEIEAALIETEKQGHRQKLDALFRVINENMKIPECSIDYKTFSRIVQLAGTFLVDKDARAKIDKRKLTFEETKQVYLLEAFIGFLNSSGLLKELPKFTYSAKFEKENT